MTEARWEWMLPGGVRVAATLASPAGTESVFVGASLVSESPRGAKPEGHGLTVRRPGDDGEGEPMNVTVTFDPRVLVCVLRVDREEIAPQKWPAGRVAARPTPRPRFPAGIVVPVVIVALGVVAFLVMRSCTSTRGDGPMMSGVHRAANGLFVARFPPRLSARPAAGPAGMEGLLLVDEERADAIVILALPSSEVTRDPWLLQKHVHGEALANVPRADGTYVETSRREETCLGQPGAVVVGRVTNRRGDQATLWSCAFSRGDAGYLVMSSLRERATPEEQRELRLVLEATELTQLGAIPPPPR